MMRVGLDEGGARARSTQASVVQARGPRRRGRGRRRIFDPVNIRLAAKPGELALGVVAMALLGAAMASSSGIRREDGDGLAVAEGVEGAW